jgi:hypothetical protein
VDGVDLDSFDAGRFIGGDPAFYVFNEDAELGTFSGLNMAASITGRHIEIAEGETPASVGFAHDRRARGLTIRLDTRQRLGDAARRRDFTTLQASGEMPVRARGASPLPSCRSLPTKPGAISRVSMRQLQLAGRR